MNEWSATSNEFNEKLSIEYYATNKSNVVKRNMHAGCNPHTKWARSGEQFAGFRNKFVNLSLAFVPHSHGYVNYVTYVAECRQWTV